MMMTARLGKWWWQDSHRTNYQVHHCLLLGDKRSPVRALVKLIFPFGGCLCCPDRSRRRGVSTRTSLMMMSLLMMMMRGQRACCEVCVLAWNRTDDGSRQSLSFFFFLQVEKCAQACASTAGRRRSEASLGATAVRRRRQGRVWERKKLKQGRTCAVAVRAASATSKCSRDTLKRLCVMLPTIYRWAVVVVAVVLC